MQAKQNAKQKSNFLVYYCQITPILIKDRMGSKRTV